MGRVWGTHTRVTKAWELEEWVARASPRAARCGGGQGPHPEGEVTGVGSLAGMTQWRRKCPIRTPLIPGSCGACHCLNLTGSQKPGRRGAVDDDFGNTEHGGEWI